MRKLVWLLMGAALASPAMAASWKVVSRSSDSDFIAIDTSSITRSGNAVTAWFKIDMALDRREHDREVKQQMRFRCDQRTEMTLSVTRYGPDGRVSYSRSVDPLVAPETPVVPETTGEQMMNAACNPTHSLQDFIDAGQRTP